MNKAVFLDRDGVIIKDVPYLNTVELVSFIPGVEYAIRKINYSGYKCIVVTNQSGVARGLISINQLSLIHNKIRNDLLEKGAFIDAIYYCPHHPEGTVKDYAMYCDCRKPNPGLIIRAAKEYNLDLTKCIIVGDKETDIEAGRRAGCEQILISTNSLSNETTYSTLNEAISNRKEFSKNEEIRGRQE